MFIEIPNENRIKSRLRYSHYVLIHIFLWKLKVFLRRIRFNGFSVVLPFSFLVSLTLFLISLEFSRILTLIASLPFGIKFGLISKSEYHKRYCQRFVSICPSCLTKET
jgi:hypothetical protein